MDNHSDVIVTEKNSSNAGWHLSDQLLDTANALNQNINRSGNDAEATSQRIGLAAEASAQRIGISGEATTNRNGIDTRASVERNGLEGRGVTERNGSEGRRITEEFGFANLNETRHEGSETRDDLEKFGFHNANVTQRAADKVEDHIERFAKWNESETRFYGHENFKAQKDSLKDILLQACGNTDRIICNDNANAKEIVLQAANNTAAMQTKLCAIELQQARDFGAIQLEASKNKCAIELDAARHAAELAKQVAECCCENKALIIEKSNHTDSLIRKLDEDRVRDQRDAYREELLALRVRSTLAPALVGSVPL